MSFLSLLTREEPVGGLEVSDSFVRIVFLHNVKSKKPLSPGQKKPEIETKTVINFAIEEKLKEGVIVEGVVKDKSGLTAALIALLKKCPKKIKYATLSLSPEIVYSKIFSFPLNVQGERLEESMKLTTGFQLPNKPEDVYLDWEKIPESKKNELILASADKKIIEGYNEAIEKAGLRLVAVEFYQTSVTRSIDTEGREAILLKEETSSSYLLSIIYRGYPYFIRSLPKKLFDGEKLEKEVQKVSDFFEAEYGVYPTELDTRDAKIVYDFYNNQTIKQDNGRWLVAVGAAMRSLTPRSQDTMVSLMSVGTEQAYSIQQASVFSGFLSGITIAASVFFVAIFIALWIFMVFVQRGATQQAENISVLSSKAVTSIEERAAALNSLTSALGPVVRGFADWGVVIREIKDKTPSGITISGFSANASGGVISLNGMAQDRAKFNLFKKILSENSIFAEAIFPPVNLGLKDNIPFTATLTLKDPQIIYPK